MSRPQTKIPLIQRFADSALMWLYNNSSFSKREAITGTASFTSYMQTLNRAYKFYDYVREGYRKNSTIYRCIRELEETCSSVKLVIKKDGEIIPEDKIPAQLQPLNKLITRPNPNQDIHQFVKKWIMQIHCGGVTYFQPVGAGKVALTTGEKVAKKTPELWLVRPDRVTIESKNGIVTGYRIDESMLMSFEDLFYIMFPDPYDEFKGCPPMQAAINVINASNAIIDWNWSIMQKSGRLSGILSLLGTENLSETRRDELIAKFQKRYMGYDNAGGIMVTAGDGAQFTPFEMSPKELDWTGSDGIYNRKICGIFRVPSQVIGDPETSKYSNYKEARRALYIDTSIPLMEMLARSFTVKIVQDIYQLDNVEIDTDVDHIDVLREELNEIYKRQLYAKDILTIDERRKLLGFDELPDGTGGEIVQPKPAPGFFDADISRETRQELDHIHENSIFRTQESRDAFVDKKDKQKSPWINKYMKKYQDYLNEQKTLIMNEFAKYRDQLNYANADFEIRQIPTDFATGLFNATDQNDKYAEAFRGLQEGLVIDFGQLSASLITEDILFDVSRPSISSWLTENLAERSRLINDETAKLIRDELQRGLDKGEGYIKLKNRLLDKFGDISKTRSVAIARTEVTRAAGRANLEGYEQGGADKHEWLSARDGNVRDSHREVDGEVRKIGEPFSIGLTYPGADGPAEEVVNCRCVTAPIVE